MQRRRLVERQVEGAERREQEARDAVGGRLGERGAQREGDEAGEGDRLRAEKPPGMDVDLAPGAAEIEREDEEEVGGPVGNDGPGKERNGAFILAFDGSRRSQQPTEILCAEHVFNEAAFVAYVFEHASADRAGLVQLSL